MRELKSSVARAAMLAAGSVITAADLAFGRMIGSRGERAERPTPSTAPPKRDTDTEPLSTFKDAKRSVIEEFERVYLERLISRTGGNLTRAASLAGIERHHLRDLARNYGLRNKPEGG